MGIGAIESGTGDEVLCRGCRAYASVCPTGVIPWEMRITVLYDNEARAPLRKAWGFSAPIELSEEGDPLRAGANGIILETQL